MIRICEICNKIMDKKDYPHYSYLQFSARRFCSKKCKWKDDEFRNKVLEARKKIGITEKQMESIRSIGLSNKGKHNSPETEFKPGKEHPQYQGGTNKHRGNSWSINRKKTLDRDKVCKRCDSDKNLDVHHIIPYKLTQDNSLNNLMVLCRSCHIIHERGYSTLVIDGEDVIIRNVPENVIKEFEELSEIEFDGKSGMTLKWLVDFRKGLLSNPNEQLAGRIDILADKIVNIENRLPEQEEEPKGPKGADGKTKIKTNR